MSLTSDELLPLLVLSVVNAGLTPLPAELLYIEHFDFVAAATGGTSIAGNAGDGGEVTNNASLNEAGYHFVTMQAVLHYLLQGDLFSAPAANASGLQSSTNGISHLRGSQSVASAMLKARQSTQELLALRRSSSTELTLSNSDNNSAAKKDESTTPNSKMPTTSHANSANKASSSASPSPPSKAASAPAKSSSGSLGRPSLSASAVDSSSANTSPKIEINLPPIKPVEQPTEDDIGPLLRRLRGF